MELLQLKYFLQLAKLQHVSRTASHLHISQPSLSATIKRLERELGAPLFVRKGRNIVLSSYGEIFKQYVEDAFLALDNGKLAIKQIQGTDNHTLNLGILSPYIWNELFQQFSDMYPEARISRYSIEDYQFFDSILTGKIDLYLGGINSIESMDLSRIQYVTLYEDDMVLLVPNDHPLAGKKEIDLLECRNEHFINLDASTSLQQFVDNMFRQVGFAPKVNMVCDYTIRDQIVSENYGISVTTKLSAQKTDAKNVTYLTITNPPEKRKLGLVWRKGKKFSEFMQRFYDTACQFYENI